MLTTFLALLGFSLIIAGVVIIYWPASLVVAGAGIVRLAVMLDSPKETNP